MNLILAGSKELVVGISLPWPLYDKEHNLLLKQGDIVRDEQHREILLAKGAYYEISWETIGGNEGHGNDIAAAESISPGQSAENNSNETFTFDDIKLKVEDRLQLEPPPHLVRERFLVKVIGFLRGVSLLVTTPITANGLRLQLLENEKVVMRSFSGQNAFAFVCTVIRINKSPFEYLHLSFPENIQGVVIRKAPRVKTHIIAAVQCGSGEQEQISALISDVSANGASLEAKQQLGYKGDILHLVFRVQLHNIEALLSLKGEIRGVLSADTSDASKSALICHGIEFQDLQPNDQVIIQSMIYQQMIENPHKLV